MLLTTIFYHVDNFCNELDKHLLQENSSIGRPASMSRSEILTIYIFFHHSKFKTFKDYYKTYIQGYYKSAFRKTVSYNRFVELIQGNMAFLCMFAISFNTISTGVSFIDSTSIAVCHNRRIHSHKVLRGIAQRGKSSMGWFYGFKLHFVINDQGELTGFAVTPGNVDDRDPEVIANVTKGLFGKLFGDRGYISQKLFEELWARGIQIITKLKHNMQNKLMSIEDKLLLKRRGIVESVGNLFKNFFNLEHTRHRSVKGFFCNIFSCIAAYAFHESKPSLTRIKNQIMSA
jgi:hypothetical protein